MGIHKSFTIGQLHSHLLGCIDCSIEEGQVLCEAHDFIILTLSGPRMDGIHAQAKHFLCFPTSQEQALTFCFS